MTVKRVLVTGGCGNLGNHAVEACLNSGLSVKVLDLPTASAKRTARKHTGRVEYVWGDITSLELGQVVADCDGVIHTAAILWPATENAPERTQHVNVEGTRRLLTACEDMKRPPRFVYVSSIGVFGHTQSLNPPRRANDPVAPTDAYTKSKLDAEDVVRSSTLDWTILRIAAALPVEPSFALSEARAQFSRVRQLFRTCPNNRIEFVHPADVGDALKAATIERAAIGMTLLIGGGDKNRFEIFDLTNDLFEAMGLGRFPVHAFGQEELYTDWLDTTESQSILNFQSRTYSQYLVETRAALGMTPIVLRPISPILRWILKRI